MQRCELCNASGMGVVCCEAWGEECCAAKLRRADLLHVQDEWKLTYRPIGIRIGKKRSKIIIYSGE